MSLNNETVFIINPMAQGGKAGKKWFDIFPLVQQFFPESSFLKTTFEGEALTFARECMVNE